MGTLDVRESLLVVLNDPIEIFVVATVRELQNAVDARRHIPGLHIDRSLQGVRELQQDQLQYGHSPSCPHDRQLVEVECVWLKAPHLQSPYFALLYLALMQYPSRLADSPTILRKSAKKR